MFILYIYIYICINVYVYVYILTYFQTHNELPLESGNTVYVLVQFLLSRTLSGKSEVIEIEGLHSFYLFLSGDCVNLFHVLISVQLLSLISVCVYSSFHASNTTFFSYFFFCIVVLAIRYTEYVSLFSSLFF